MDRTKEFILQCERAIEIQKMFPQNPIIGDCVILNHQYPYIVTELQEYYDDNTWLLRLGENDQGDSKRLIWLPRQDQLQEMINIKNYISYPSSNWGLVCVFYSRFSKNAEYSPQQIYKMSMEQLWLVFVMKEKYNKTWNGETWIN